MIRKLDYIIKNLDFKKKIFFSIFIVLSFMIMGYATYSTSLFATGGTEITQDYENFKVIIDKVVYDGYINEINNDNVSFSFTTNLSDDLTESDVYVELFNDSTQYDVTATLLCDAVSDSTYSITLDKSQFRLNAKTKDVVNIKLNKLGEFTNKTINCQFTIEGLEKNELANDYTEDAPSSNEIFVERSSDSDNKTLKEELDELRSMAKNRGTHIGDEFSFDYTGNIQTFSVPYDGIYKLEVWGAQGGFDTNGSDNYRGGYGGYSVGTISLNKDDNLYVVVGGTGEGGCYNKDCSGGYNGGGIGTYYTDSDENHSSGGGGATHIALDTGVLSTLSSHASDNRIYIVAGGGGGGYWHSYGSSTSNYGGDGGGYLGVNGNDGNYESTIFSGAQGGSQSAGGARGFRGANGSFGLGGSGNTACNDGTDTGCASSGGGGGYYGGGAAAHGGSAGGSGYIGNSLLSNKSMYCYNCTESNDSTTKTVSTTCVNSDPKKNCSKSGNGYAKITYLGKD